MRKPALYFYFFLLCLVYSCIASAQQSDFLVLKKGDRTERSYFEGTAIAFSTAYGSYGGNIEKINKDSIFLIQYDIRRVPTRLGVYVLDTFATYHLVFHYQDILAMDKKRYGFNWNSAGGTLLGTGSLLTVLGAGSWLVTKKDSRSYARPEFVAACAGLAGLGYLLLKTNTNNYKLGKKYSLEYIRVK